MSTQTHRPFADGKFKGLWDSVRNSPYPLHYTLRWPWFFHYPSTRRHSKLPAMPDSFGTPGGPDDLKLVMAGDIMVLNGDRPPVLSDELRQLIGGADLFIANLEAPLGQHQPVPDKKYTFRFHMPAQFLDAIQQQTGLPYARWILSNANNHSGDAGIDGFEQSIALLTERGIGHLGHRAHTAPHRAIDVKGIRLGVAAWTHWLNRDVFDQAQPVLAAKDIHQYPLAQLKQREQLDFLLGMPHWEYEFQHFPKNQTRKHARAFIGKGFDMLLGSHPHVLQPYELIDGRHCFYSLGNLCGLGIAWPVKIITLLEVHLRKQDGVTRPCYFKHHYFYQLHTDNEISIVPLSELAAPLAQRARGRLAQVIRHHHKTVPALSQKLP